MPRICTSASSGQRIEAFAASRQWRIPQSSAVFLKPHKDGVALVVRVVPNSSVNALVVHDPDRLTVKLTSPPVEGRANKDLLKFLGKKLGMPPSSLTIISGQRSREKVVLAVGADVETIEGRLASCSRSLEQSEKILDPESSSG